MSEVNEFFALPMDNVEVSNTLGLKLYTNANLKNKYISVMYDSRKTKKIARNIENMVDKELLNPVWLNSGILSTLAYKLVGPSKKEQIKKEAYAFYSPADHKIFLFIDNSMSFGFTNNSLLVDLTVHETMHMGAGVLKTKYLTVFKKELDLYYDEFLSSYFQIPTDKKINASKIYSWIFKNFETNNSVATSTVYKYKDILFKEMSPVSMLESKDLEDKVKHYSVAVFLALTGRMSEIAQTSELMEVSIRARQAYTDAFKVAPPRNNFYIQETFACSEVIAMLSEMTTTASMYSLFKILGK